jgi:hypothetical protein
MILVALHGIITVDIEELQKDILAAYDTDLAQYFTVPHVVRSDSSWTLLVWWK